MVLFLFVVMLLNVPREDAADAAGGHALAARGPRRVGALLAVVFLAELVWALARLVKTPVDGGPQVAEHVQSVRQIGIELFTTHAFAFEVTSVLILVAMVGAVVLAKRNL